MSFFKIFESKKDEPITRPPKRISKDKNSQQPPAVINPVDVVIGKLKKGNKQALMMPDDELKEWALSLCKEEEVVEWYLNADFATTISLHNKLEEVQQRAPNEMPANKSALNFTSSNGESTVMVPKKQDPNSDLEDRDVDYEIDDIKKENEQAFMKVGKKIKVKLVIAEICKSSTQKAIRKMLSPILTKLDLQQQFGMFHSALVIGPWYLEWNNSSLCIPRKCYSSAAMLACDLSAIGGSEGNQLFDLDDTVKKVAKVVIDWNTNRSYDQRTANCQQFVDDICKTLGIEMNLMGPLGEFLTRLRQEGKGELAFTVDDEMRQQLNIKESKKEFKSHKELDDFVHKLQKEDPMFEENFPLEWGLLKSFDRAFWLRHFKNKEDPTYLSEECPFKDPTVTASMKEEWF